MPPKPSLYSFLHCCESQLHATGVRRALLWDGQSKPGMRRSRNCQQCQGPHIWLFLFQSLGYVSWQPGCEREQCMPRVQTFLLSHWCWREHVGDKSTILPTHIQKAKKSMLLLQVKLKFPNPSSSFTHFVIVKVRLGSYSSLNWITENTSLRILD